MSGRSYIAALVATLLVPAITGAQHPSREDLAEEFLYMEDSGTLPRDELEEAQETLMRGMDLNSAGLEELTASGVFTPFQAQVLIDYREKYGRLWSLYELQALPGFRNFPVESGEATLCAPAESNPPGNPLKSGLVMVDAVRTFPLSAGYRDAGLENGSSPYPGSPWKTGIRLRSGSWKKFHAAVSYEKDNGEPWGEGRRPEYLSGYVAYSGKGAVREIVAGNYRLKQGLGLVSGSGFTHAPGELSVNRSTLARIQPSSALSGTGTCSGLGTRVETRHLRILAWTSYREFDLPVTGINTGEDPFDSRLESGLHRTGSEREGRSLGFRFHTGVQALAWHRELTVGVLAAAGRTGLTRQAQEITGLSPSSRSFQAVSIHMNWRKKKFETFGELAFREPGQPAFLSGFRYSFSDFLQGFLLLHHYSPGYRGIDPSAYASGSKTENEQGMAFTLHAEPGRFLSARFTFEHFRYPAPRYQTVVPSTGTRIGITLQGPGRGNLQWKAGLVSRTMQTTPLQEGLNHRPLVTRNSSRAEFRLDYLASGNFGWQSRLLLSGPGEMGFAALQQFRYTGKKTGLTLQFVAFHVDDWDKRFYLYEPSPLYSFSFPAICGRGQKMTVMVYLKPVRRGTVTFKFTRLYYFDRDSTGSGNDLTEGDRKYQLNCQVRWNF